jgi:hypothetical protein
VFFSDYQSFTVKHILANEGFDNPRPIAEAARKIKALFSHK